MPDRRLFLALWPTLRQRASIAEVAGPLAASVAGRAVDRRNWHLTLVFIGAIPEARIAALQAAVAGISCQPLRLRFDRLTFWARPKIACLRTSRVPDELLQLKMSLEAALQSLGIQTETRVYQPHITVARKVRRFAPRPLARPLGLRWSGFELMESVSTPRGVRYHPLKQQLRRDS